MNYNYVYFSCSQALPKNNFHKDPFITLEEIVKTDKLTKEHTPKHYLLAQVIMQDIIMFSANTGTVIFTQ